MSCRPEWSPLSSEPSCYHHESSLVFSRGDAGYAGSSAAYASAWSADASMSCSCFACSACRSASAVRLDPPAAPW